MDNRDFLMHIGNRNSGRYKRGSGKRPYQHEILGGLLGRSKKKNSKSKVSQEHESSRQSVKGMTDDELSSAIKRLQMEKQYRELINTASGRKQTSRGKQLVKDIIEKSAKNIGEQTVTYLMGTAVNKAFAKEIVDAKKRQKGK